MRLLTSGFAEVKDENDDASNSQADDQQAPFQVASAAEDGEQNLFAAHLRINARVDVSGMSLTSAAACALLSHLSRAISRHELPGEEASPPLRSIEALRLESMLHITAATRRALGVFHEETFASSQSESKKEGVSIFSILNWTVSAQGEALLSRWIRYPSTELETIEARHEAVACLLSPQNAADSALMVAELKNGANMPRLLESSFVRGTPTKKAWQTLSNFATRATNLREILQGLGLTCSPLSVIASDIPDAAMRRLAELGDILDWEESKREGTVIIRAGYDRELDKQRRTYAGLPSFLSRVAAQLQSQPLQAYADKWVQTW